MTDNPPSAVVGAGDEPPCLGIEVTGLTKWYGDRRALWDVTFSVARSETVGLLGPNGAGKTTIMRIIAGLLAQDSGQVVIEGIDMATARKHAIAKIGYVPERPPLYRELSVAAHLEFWARLRDVPAREIKNSVEKAIAAAGLDGVQDALARQLSKGFGQRLNLAQALVHNPTVLILDEPTVGLDPDQVVQTRELISRLGAEKTLIVSSHILADVARTCDRVVIVNAGRVVGQSTLSQGQDRTSSDRITSLERLYLDTVLKA
ncbi:MAG: ABC transporter ATP-binding protein [Candidatus Coatesbacteria bacterium]|nr:ABC transporter ATP-binding protein [Candidatus Coatesbacteria bacterium]